MWKYQFGKSYKCSLITQKRQEALEQSTYSTLM